MFIVIITCSAILSLSLQ